MTAAAAERGSPIGPEEGNAWPFPWRDEWDGCLSRREWAWLLAAFAGLHYLVLALSVVSGNFDPAPNHDHVHVMRGVLETGLPQVAVWPPGFGYYLAGKWIILETLGWPYWMGKVLFDPLLVLASGALATLLGRALTRNRRLAAASGLGQVAAPIFLLASAEGLAVLLFQPFFLGSLLLLAEGLARRHECRIWSSLALVAAAGAVMGLACLVRANPQFLAVALVPAVLLGLRGGTPGRTRWLARGIAWVVIFLLAQNLVTAPWLWWQRQLGEDGVLAAPVFWYAYVDGMARHPGNPVSDWVRERRRELPLDFDTMVEINSRWMAEDPGALARLYLLKSLRTWYLSDSGRWDRAIFWLHLPWWLGSLAGTVVWIRRRRGDPALWLVLTALAYMWAVSAAVSGLARYMAPVYGLLGLLAGVVVEQARQLLRWRERRRARRRFAAGCAGAAEAGSGDGTAASREG